jgi:hypothetical protein
MLMFLLASMLIFSCSEDSDNPTQPATSEANARVIHTSYNAPAVDILVDNAVAISNLSYGESSGYAKVEAGQRNIKVTVTGTTSPAVIEADLPLETDKDYTVFLQRVSSPAAVIRNSARKLS